MRQASEHAYLYLVHSWELQASGFDLLKMLGVTE